MNLISDISAVLLMQHTAHENLITQNDEISKKCISLTEQIVEKNITIDNLIKQIEEMKKANNSNKKG